MIEHHWTSIVRTSWKGAALAEFVLVHLVTSASRRYGHGGQDAAITLEVAQS